MREFPPPAAATLDLKQSGLPLDMEPLFHVHVAIRLWRLSVVRIATPPIFTRAPIQLIAVKARSKKDGGGCSVEEF